MTLLNKKLVQVLAVSAALSIASIGKALASTESYKLTLATEAGDSKSPQGQSMQLWSKLVKEKSHGRIKINVFYQGELGGQQELFDQLVKDNIDMMLTWPQTSYDDRIGIIYLPYLVLNWDDAIKAYGHNGWLKKIVSPVFSDLGLKYFGPYPEGFGGIATKGRYATNFKQAQGLKVRSQPIFPLPQTMKAMGFQAVPIDWSEVYTSIQTGVVDGDSSNVIYWDYQYFRDQLDYYVQSNQNFSSFALLMNQEKWKSLDKEDQDIISSAADEVINLQFKNAKKEDAKWIKAAQEGGMQYIKPTPEELTAWVKRVRADVWPQAEAKLGSKIMDEVRANVSTPN
ncbi:TRAP transporter substrate-binding protein DctP [Marinomonas flavescens]|uniref:TRAP transporter substrate-binding protein DctP n=1 Tax=Marinomonas flavescens TaxID=2529379 RepID=UPI001054A6D7|nr:TRAP transporter substrate-binding protein DctP [Marinomonas flavescens]